ncbi:MAG: histidine phosphatase family protein [Dehalococcoidia bacterium]|nr:histidine phosphatase family protein [Dehalococcoidia bacterium]MDZ4245900.1 histidine phosphatase family protein [Dehalococcoidia bacterium]
MAKLFLVRHASTIWAGTGRYQGFSDVPLNQEGLEQGEKLGKRLLGEKFTAVYSSDLQRAHRTAQLIVSPRNPTPVITTTPDIRELNFGDFDGQVSQEVTAKAPDSAEIWWGRNVTRPFPGGESLQDLSDRVQRFLKKYVPAGEGDSILIVAHTGAVAIMTCLLLGIGIDHWWRFKTDNTALGIIETFPGGAVLKLFNDCRHLDPV